jgi:hypothetical protein
MDLLSKLKDMFQMPSKSQLRSTPMIQQVVQMSLMPSIFKFGAMATELMQFAITLLSFLLTPWTVKSTSTVSEEQQIAVETFNPMVITATPTTAPTTLTTSLKATKPSLMSIVTLVKVKTLQITMTILTKAKIHQ